MKVLIVEDNFELANGYRKELKKRNMICDVAKNFEEGKSKVGSNEYDIILLDINLPGKSGIDLLNSIRFNRIEVGIIMVTARTEEELISESLDFGADDYIQKPVRFTELVARINAVYRRMQTRDTSNLKTERIEVDYARSLIKVDGVIVKMTNKEFMITTKMCELYPGFCSTEQLNQAIYDEYEISSATVRVHIYNLKKKLEKLNITIDNTKNLGYKLCFQQ